MCAGTKEGALKAKLKNLQRDPDFYKNIGSKGGKAKFPGKGFAGNIEIARLAGKKGGTISKRKPKVINES